MRAVIMATGEWRDAPTLADWHPVPLIPLLDRPLVQHMVEFLAPQGVRHYDFVLSHLPEKVEAHLGDGTRWGAKFTYHLARDAAHPYWLLQTLDLAGADEPLLFGHADRLVPLKLAEGSARAGEGKPVLFGHRDADGWHWSGWAILSRAHLVGLGNDADEQTVASHLMRDGQWVEVGEALVLGGFNDILSAQRGALEKRFGELLLSGREVEPGIWVSRNVMLHPTAQVLAPAYLGENLEIGPLVTVGPNAVVGAGCIIDRGCTVSNALVMPGSYVGQYLSVEDAVVDRNRLLQGVGEGGPVVIKDDFLLASLSDYAFGRALGGFLARLVALLLLLLLSPVFLGVLLARLVTGGPAISRRAVVHTPTEEDEHQWREYGLWGFISPAESPPPIHWGLERNYYDLVLRFLPGLVNVVKGDLRLVGLPPRTKEEIKLLPPEWQRLYLRCKSGLVTELAARRQANPNEDEIYASEAWYAAAVTWKIDVWLFCLYLVRTLLFLRPSRERVATSERMFPDEESIGD